MDINISLGPAHEAWSVCGSHRKAAKHLGISRRTLRDRLCREKQRVDSVRGKINGPPIPEIAVPTEGFVVRRNSAEFDAEGQLVRQWIENGQGNYEGYKIPEGHTVKGESVLLDPNGNVIVKWVKTREDSSGLLIDGIREVFETYKGFAPKISSPSYGDDSLITIYPLPDLHFGMHGWGKETGENYDIKIATQLALETVSSLVSQSRSSKHAVLLGLGDYFHANDRKSVTPAHGNLLDVDGRWQKVYFAGAKLATAIVEIIAKKHEDVEVIFLPGNHDPDSAMCLSVSLNLFYSSNPRIRVSDNPSIVWYRRFGSTLMGATHGHTIKTSAMAMMLATDRAEDWGQSKYYYFWHGHFHQERVSEVGRVRVECFQSPAARDAFTAGAGYRSGRSLSAITIHKDLGEIGRHKVNILEPSLH